jgi:hypothetical protein
VWQRLVGRPRRATDRICTSRPGTAHAVGRTPRADSRTVTGALVALLER